MNNNHLNNNHDKHIFPVQTPVVAVGASAGGLDALEKFFRHIPRETGLAFVLIQHLSPDHKSVMGELMSRYSPLRILRVEEGMELEEEVIYLIPPGKEMTLDQGAFHLEEREENVYHLPIDRFLASLAENAGPNANAVILSGSGSDGAKGVLEIHNAGGKVLVQSAESAGFDGMPRSAAMTGVADHIGTPEELAKTLLSIKTSLKTFQETSYEMNVETEQTPVKDEYASIFTRLSAAFSVDFSQYKPATVIRRVERRMQMCDVKDITSYVELLEQKPEELDRLYRDLMIDVTQFFRDPEAFKYLEENILPLLMKHYSPGEEFRVWVAGCATGEEVYSIAMLLDECTRKLELPLNFQIFATDAHRGSLSVGSNGVYQDEKMKHVSEERKNNYFEKVEGGWRVVASLRRMVAFAEHNILRDPPFMRMDMISCRNLLIYLKHAAQEKVLRLFQYSMKQNGTLFLGGSESITGVETEFETIHHRYNFFRKVSDKKAAPVPLGAISQRQPAAVSFARPADQRKEKRSASVFPLLMEKYMPPSLLLNHNRDLLHVFGGAGKFLSFEGEVSTDVISMLQGELRMAVSTAFQRVLKDNQKVQYGAVKINLEHQSERAILDISAEPFRDKTTNQSYVLVIFSERDQKVGPSEPQEPSDTDKVAQNHLNYLEQELQETRENLQTTIEELETSNEELQTTNEELLTSNEELQSTNEELQSVNEELHTVNAEYEKKNEELIQANQDLSNLINCTDIGTVFLDQDLKVRKFTPSVANYFYLREQDIGRPLGEISNLFNRSNFLLEKVNQVLLDGNIKEEEVTTHEGHPFLQRIHPYRDGTGEIKGAVLTYVDLRVVKEAQEELKKSEELRGAIMDSVDSHISVLDREGNIIAINAPWENFARENDAESLISINTGANYFDACACDPAETEYTDAQATIEGIRAVLQGEKEWFEMEYPCHSPEEKRWFLMRVTPLYREEGGAVVSHINITARKIAEKNLQKAHDELEQRVEERTQELKMMHQERTMILDSLVEKVVYLDPNMRIIWANQTAADYAGEDKEKLIGKYCYHLWRKRKEPCPDCPVIKSMQLGTSCSNEIDTPEGHIWQCTGSPVMDENGNIMGMVETTVDITERKKYEEKISDYTKELELKKKQLEELYEQLDQQVERAWQIHKRVLPLQFPQVEGMSFSAHYQPAQTMGGDFYDLIRKKDKLILYLSDVSGHGLDGAMMSVFVKNTITNYLSFSSDTLISPNDIISYLARRYLAESYPEDYMICMFIAVIDLNSKEMTYAGAGFQDTPLVIKNSQEKIELHAEGLPISSSLPKELLCYPENSLNVKPDTTILFNTDGITEQQRNGRMYKERLKQFFFQNHFWDPEVISCLIKKDFKDFNGYLQGDDDITLLIAQLEPPEKEEIYREYHSDLNMLEVLNQEAKEFFQNKMSEADMFLLGVHELAANAIEHGNGCNSQKKIKVWFKSTSRYVQAVVEDQGEGFDWKEKILNPTPLHEDHERGRGIIMTKMSGSLLCYNHKGNRVTIAQEVL